MADPKIQAAQVSEEKPIPGLFVGRLEDGTPVLQHVNGGLDPYTVPSILRALANKAEEQLSA